MTTNLPKISITTDNCAHSTSSDSDDSDSISDSCSNDSDSALNFYGGATDIEDFDSQIDINGPCSRKPSPNTLAPPKRIRKASGDGTDIEDCTYNGTDSEEEDASSCAYPELKISLEEFVQDDVEQQVLLNNSVNETVERKAGDFLEAQHLNGITTDYLTDCEEYHTDSEIECDLEKSVCVDLEARAGEIGRVSIADAAIVATERSDSIDSSADISVMSDISDLASALSDVACGEKQGISGDDGLWEVSAGEETCQTAFSDSEAEDEGKDSMTGIITSNEKCLLGIDESNEELLTDIERFDDSAAEGNGSDEEDESANEQPIPRPLTLASSDDGSCETDCEDLLCDENVVVEDVKSVDISLLPLPQREVVLLKEDEHGDTTVNVMPMENEFQFGMCDYSKNECVTDIEDCSCAESSELSNSSADQPLTANGLIEGEVTTANERMKSPPLPLQSKRSDFYFNAESITDVEEMYVPGTNCRRKRQKSRTITKSKSKYLDTPISRDGGTTDVEDVDLSEDGVPSKVGNTSDFEQPPLPWNKVTHLGQFIADNISDGSEAGLGDVECSSCKDFITNSKIAGVVMEASEAKLFSRHMEAGEQHEQQERENSTSNAEDPPLLPDADSAVRDKLCEILNESRTMVHEMCTHNFSFGDERLHIKDMPREAVTDVEYVESDESATRGSN